MMTAVQARAKTQERLQVIACEFIDNNVGAPLQEAIDTGRFHCMVSFEGIPSPIKTGEEVVDQLKLKGYKAEHVYYDGPNGYDNYILIQWGEDE